MAANDRQVGGRHYTAGFQHWDLMVANNPRWLEACITKYATRWNRKNGPQDVEKALHYLEKLEEVLRLGLWQFPPAREAVALRRFCEDNNLTEIEESILSSSLTYTTFAELDLLRNDLTLLLAKAKSLQI